MCVQSIDENWLTARGNINIKMSCDAEGKSPPAPAPAALPAWSPVVARSPAGDDGGGDTVLGEGDNTTTATATATATAATDDVTLWVAIGGFGALLLLLLLAM